MLHAKVCNTAQDTQNTQNTQHHTPMLNERHSEFSNASHNERGCQFSNEKGAGMVEYALLVTLMSIGCMGAVRLMKISVEESFIDVRLALACTGVYDPETDICIP